MDRNSILYKLRRKGQCCLSKICSPKWLSEFYSKKVLKKTVDLNNPKTFNEKIQWCKLYYYPKNPLVVQCTDKLAVRSFIKEKGYGKTLVPFLGVWKNAKEIEWDKLPSKFVLKCNHGCAYNIVCSNKEKLDKKAAAKCLNGWLKEDFGAFNIELHYSKIKDKRIICEEFLGECITDYKFFCFNGEPKFIYVSNDLVHDRQAQIGFFYLDGQKMPLKRNDYADIESVEFPSFFDEMKQMAKNLSAEFPFVRVDFFLAKDKYYFAELTFTPSAGMMPFNPDKYDLEWGDMLDLSKIKKGKDI